MHADATFAIGALVLLALLAGGVVLCVLFFFKRTRPLAWTLLGLGTLGLMFLVSYAWLSVDRRDVEMAPIARPTDEAWLHAGAEEYNVDINALLADGPTIQLDRKTVHMGESAHPSRPAQSLEVEAVEGAPPEPQHVDVSHAQSPDDQVAAPSDSTGTIAQAPGDRRAAVARQSPAGEKRPDWVDNAPKRDPQNYPVVIVTDPFPSEHDAYRQANQLMEVAASEVVSDLVGEFGQPHSPYDRGHNHRVAWERLRGMGLTPGELRNEIWRDDYVEHLDLHLPTGEVLRVHTLLEFDEEFQIELQRRWREYQAHQRLGVIGMIAAGVVGLLALVWGTLKFDTATKGYYTKWLVVGGGLAAVGLFFLVVAVA